MLNFILEPKQMQNYKIRLLFSFDDDNIAISHNNPDISLLSNRSFKIRKPNYKEVLLLMLGT